MSTEITGTTISPPQPDFNAIKRQQQQMWAAGNYNLIGSRILLISELLCEAVDLRAGQRVLDIASGTGSAALAAARRSGVVISSDYVPDLLEHGRARTRQGWSWSSKLPTPRTCPTQTPALWKADGILTPQLHTRR